MHAPGYLRFLPALSIVLFTACDSTSTTTSESESAITQEYIPTEYELTGDNDTTLVLVHGWNIDQDYWKEQVAVFSDDYTVLTMNLVTDELKQDSNREWTAERFAQDIVSIIEAENLNHLILVGHSMAGEIVLAVRELVPDKTVAIIGVDCFKDVGFILTENVQNNIDSFLVRFEEDYAAGVEEMVTTGLFESDTEHQKAYKRVLRDYEKADPKIAIPIYQNMFPALESAKDKLAALPFPLRIIVSDYSPTNEEALRKYTKHGYRIKTIRQSNHFPMIEQPEQFNQALKAFLDAIRGESSQ